MLKLVIFIFSICLKLGFQSEICSSTFPGTTPNFKNIFIGRCLNFLNVLHKENCDIALSNLNCTKIWDEFFKVVVNKNSCDIKIQDYDKYIELTSHNYDREKSIFWSGTNLMAHQSNFFQKYFKIKRIFLIFQ